MLDFLQSWVYNMIVPTIVGAAHSGGEKKQGQQSRGNCIRRLSSLVNKNCLSSRAAIVGVFTLSGARIEK